MNLYIKLITSTVIFLSIFLTSGTLLHAFERKPSSFALSTLEQSNRIDSLARSKHSALRIYGKNRIVASMPYIQRDYQELYRLGSIVERRAISERQGNQAAARYAAERGWKKILGSSRRAIPQGPDSAYWDPARARLIAIERKGGASRPNFNYSSPQGTNAYHVRAAKRAILSNKTPFAEKVANARIIIAAQNRRLVSGVIKGGSHGKPTNPILKGAWDRTPIRREAVQIERLLRKNPEFRQVFTTARNAQTSDMSIYRSGIQTERAARASKMASYRLEKVFSGAGLIFAGALAWDAYHESSTALLMWNNPHLATTATPYLQTGRAVARWGQVGLLSINSSSGFLRQGAVRTLGKTAGKYFLPVAIAAEALGTGIAINEYRHGRISTQQFNRSMTGSGVFFTCTGAGALIGSAFSGIGAAPGAVIGAIVGGIGEGTLRIRWYFLDKSFSVEQQKLRTSTVYNYYGVTLE